MRFILLILLITFKSAYANVALDELNGLLAQKEQKIMGRQIKNERLKDLQNNYYFIFIYRSNCPHCHKIAPILKDFLRSFHISTQSYSVDGESLPGFEAKPLTPQLFQSLYASGGYKPAVPALFLVNRHTLEAYATLFGEAEPYQLALRVDELMQHIEEKFND
ncbi:type-F conjugative transfer system pilin assembly thiol-disulfide isomerase TrbB [Legionella septentrionalis]|uniref:type-F conjugative transfer system pilin assembly thiol-disulfide isomerase TrbB n=1 Tax=Legionella septentrionalis TaxID=2498109 RepID=UPI001F38B64E|nr:type-F conjugative transfer system pilin assembly thiol-disulfide isomerase TrbB [Legionella septentrionalis]